MGRGKLTPQDLEDLKVISSNIQRLLEESGMKQSQLASILNIPKSSFNEYVKGRTLPKAGNIQKIADYFGLKKSDIDPRFSKKSTSSVLEKITYTARQLNHKRQLKVLDFSQQQLSEQKQATKLTAKKHLADRKMSEEVGGAEYQKIVDKFIANEIKNQDNVYLDSIKKAKNLYQALGNRYETIVLYGEVSAGTGIWVDHEKQETIQYPAPIPKHDIALKVSGNSMEPLFYNGDVIFVKKTPEIYHGQFIIVIVNNKAYLKKLYKKEQEIRLISLNSRYDDIILQEDDDIKIIGTVIT
ncbi:XRE family transcriptional regulator [Streptococcus orisasini]|uniref:XRE family transcriptional regulator n=1 Tax=Streptococcus orisasini TaxID=1080071 RepID=UPI000708F29D|nr:XRE family transcriptional regulator [Streptococcus orisasini]